ncbi:sugar kinase [Labrys miyagiensis]
MVDRISQRLVVEALLRGPLSDEALARETGLPKRVLRTAVGGLETAGLIERSGGQGQVLHGLRGGFAYCVGVDLGGTKVTAAVADHSGTVLAEATEVTDPRGGHHVLEQIRGLAARLSEGEGIEPHQIGGITVGMPGVIHPHTGAVSLGPNIAGLSDLDVPGTLGLLFDQAVQVENDVNLAVLGEAWRGHAEGCQDVGFMALGTGTGLGLIVNGRLVRGAAGAAGEISYLPFGNNLHSIAALDVGAFELEIGSAGIVDRYKASGGVQARTVRDIFALLERDDSLAARVIDDVAAMVALAIVALQSTLDLEKIVLGGSIGVRSELVERVQRALPRLFARPVDVAASALGNRAGLIGAVAAAVQGLQQRRASLFGLANGSIFLEPDLVGAAE